MSWEDRAVCKGTEEDVFFPEDTSSETAKRLCAACPVKQQCLDFALTERITHGIWGGTTSAERIRILYGEPDAPEGICPVCGAETPIGRVGRPRVYCSRRCTSTAGSRRHRMTMTKQAS